MRDTCKLLAASALTNWTNIFVSPSGQVDRSLPWLLFQMDAAEIILSFLTSITYIGLSIPKFLTLTRLLPTYHMFGKNNCVNIQAIVNFCLLRDPFPHKLTKMDMFPGVSSVTCTMNGKHCTPSLWLNTSHIANFTQQVTSNRLATQ
jgi:hypothetical protein